MWFTVGFGASCALGAYLLPGGWNWMLALCAGVLAMGAMLFDRGRKRLRRTAAVLLGLCLGFAWFAAYDAIYLNAAVKMDAQTQDIMVRAGDYSFETDYGSAVDGTVILEGKTYQARVYLREAKELLPGDTVTGTFRFRVTTPDGSEPSTYHKGRGMFLLLYQTGDVTYGHSRERSWRDLVAELRQELKDILRNSFPEEAFPFAQALLLGDTNDLSYETDSDFKISGIRHVVAVSGLHVSILFALLSFLTFKKRFLTAFAGFPLLFLFAALAGFTPSITRSCLMWSLTLLALLFDRSYDSATALSFASLVMLLGNPLVITDAGFQLSVGSVAGIYLFSGSIRKWILSLFGKPERKTWKASFAQWFSGSVSITLSAMTITTPLCALYFGTVSLVGAATNLLALWVIGFVFYGILAVCLLGFFWQAGAALLAKVIAWLIRYVLFIAKTMADIPLAAVYTRSPYIAAWLAFVYILLLLFLAQKNRKPMLLGCCAVLGLCVSLLASWAEPMVDDVRFTVLNVGQGQCLLLQSEGRTYMVDCGGDSDEETADLAAEALLSQGVAKLDGLILTHCDRDHAGAAGNLLSRVDAELLILPPDAYDLALKTEGQAVYATDDLELTYGSTRICIFSGTYPGNGNENSLCVLFDTEKCDILITGDRNGFGERSLLRNAAIPEVDILVAGHHGSKNSTCEELLAAVKPDAVCISVGLDNSYGHPAPELLERLGKFGCTVYRTDLHGDILIRR